MPKYDSLPERLAIHRQDYRISIVGAGGKSTLLSLLGRVYRERGEKVVLTTTTHIRRPEQTPELRVLVDSTLDELQAAVNGQTALLMVGSAAPDGKLAAPAPKLLEWLAKQPLRLLIEADGAHQFPIKLPAAHEPVILPQTQRVIAVAGLSALGHPLGQVCHRAELARELLDCPLEQPLTPAMLAVLLQHGYGTYEPVWLLNQADTPALRFQAREVARQLCSNGRPQRLLATALLQEDN
ncbi:MAG: putative selenium-dependent hydroxylase accessory protein YqeC [Anaerotruncus sp.]|nr:putative selenium-dependent hydroxylase accessory protein YqeC [Anaerotruncus sp.]